MHALDEKYAGIVFAKTDKGREEMASRAHGLNPMQRRVLIIIDGIKKFDAIIEMIPAVIPAGEMGKIFSVLLGQGFIVAVADTVATPIAETGRNEGAAVLQMPSAPARRNISLVKPASEEDSLIQDPSVIRLIKDFMTTTSQTYLGLLGADVIQRIERAKSADQLLSVLGYWHMALQDSREGHRFAAPYLEQVRNALNGKGQLMLPEGHGVDRAIRS